MRIKFLTVIASVFVLLLTITSCLGSEDEYEYSTDDTIWAFALDTIYGVNYKFTIDQVNRKIFNIDSVPFSADTIINKILITTFSTVSGSEYFMTGDTAFHWKNDSLDLSNTMSGLKGVPMLIKVYAPDALHHREYEIEVRRHQQDPDSLVWGKTITSFSKKDFAGKQKSAVWKESLVILTSNTAAYVSTVPEGKSFESKNISGLPSNIKLSSLTSYKDMLYIVAEDGKVFSSEDVVLWKESSLSGNVITLLTCFPNAIAGIVSDGGVYKFATTDADATEWAKTGKNVPEHFPLEEISSTVFKSNTGLWKSMLVGKTTTGDRSTVPWFSFDGENWADLATTSDYHLPAMEQPSIIHYNNKLYAFGGKFKGFYSSDDGLVWKPVTKKVKFPKEFNERGFYSMAIDSSYHIWMVWSKGTWTEEYTDEDEELVSTTHPHSDEVWRGRINKLGFDIK